MAGGVPRAFHQQQAVGEKGGGSVPPLPFGRIFYAKGLKKGQFQVAQRLFSPVFQLPRPGFRAY